MQKNRVRFAVNESNLMHDDVDELYEALIDSEDDEAMIVLERIAERVRNIKADLTGKEN